MSMVLQHCGLWAPLPHWKAALRTGMQLLSGVAGEHCSGSSHGCWVESSWFLGYSYVSKALVCIILGRMWARQDVFFASLGLVSYRPLAHCIKRSSAGPRAEAN